jgi:hypothetical protein
VLDAAKHAQTRALGGPHDALALPELDPAATVILGLDPHVNPYHT